MQHGSLSNLLAATREAFGVGEGDVMPALASYAFDIWLFEALLPLTSGAARCAWWSASGCWTCPRWWRRSRTPRSCTPSPR